MEWMDNKLGWNKFITKKWKTYENLTLEVLSALNVHINPEDFQDLDLADELKITFQLANEPSEIWLCGSLLIHMKLRMKG